MTTALAPAGRLSRPVQAARLQLIGPPIQLLIPWVVLASSFLVNVVVFALIPLDQADSRITGGLLAIYVTALITHLVTMTQLFPFALGLSVTRRDFFVGTAGFVLVQSAVQGLALTVFAAIERATRGWGTGMHFFDLPFMDTGNWFTRWLAFTVPFVFLAFLSILAGTVYKRFGQLGMWAAVLAGVLLGGAAAILVTWLGAWGAVGRFFADTPSLALFAGYPAVLAVVAAVVAWFTLRRATP